MIQCAAWGLPPCLHFCCACWGWDVPVPRHKWDQAMRRDLNPLVISWIRFLLAKKISTLLFLQNTTGGGLATLWCLPWACLGLKPFSRRAEVWAWGQCGHIPTARFGIEWVWGLQGEAGVGGTHGTLISPAGALIPHMGVLESPGKSNLSQPVHFYCHSPIHLLLPVLQWWLLASCCLSGSDTSMGERDKESGGGRTRHPG